MGRITFTPNLARHIDCPAAEFQGATVREALESAFAENPRLRTYIVDEQGRLRRHVNIFINDRPVDDRERLGDPVAPGDELYVFQALSGG